MEHRGDEGVGIPTSPMAQPPIPLLQYPLLPYFIHVSYDYLLEIQGFSRFREELAVVKQRGNDSRVSMAELNEFVLS